MGRHPIPIALVLTSFDPGGTERQMTELMTRIDPSRFQVHAACFRREGAWLPKVERVAGSIAEFPLKGFASLSTASLMLAFVRWLRRERIALVQACDFYANVFALPGAALAGVPARIGSRRDILLPVRSGQQHRLQALSYGFAHCVVANSQAAAAQLRREGVADSKITVIPNGIDMARFTTRSVGGARRVVTTVANLRPEKGHDVLIEAAALVCQRHPDLQFRIVGDGSMRRELEALVHNRGLDGRVVFLGHREDIPDLLATTDVFVLPSLTEAFPNGLVEAMAAGIPCIASDTGGVPELLQHGRNGFLVPVGDAAALADALTTLIADGQQATEFGTAARATVQARYSFERMVHAFEALYERLLAGRRVPIRALYAR